jgi:hypothetical protein
VRVAWSEQVDQPGVEFGNLGFEFGHFGGERLVLTGQFTGGFQIAARGLQLAVGRHDRRQLCEPAAHPLGGDGVGVQRRIGELAFEVGMLGQQRLDR